MWLRFGPVVVSVIYSDEWFRWEFLRFQIDVVSGAMSHKLVVIFGHGLHYFRRSRVLRCA